MLKIHILFLSDKPKIIICKRNPNLFEKFMDQQGMQLRPMVTSTARVVEHGKNRTVIVAAIESEGNRMSPKKIIQTQPKK